MSKLLKSGILMRRETAPAQYPKGRVVNPMLYLLDSLVGKGCGLFAFENKSAYRRRGVFICVSKMCEGFAMNTAVCDDEQPQRKQIKKYIPLCSTQNTEMRVDLFENGEDLIAAYQNNSFYDIVFLDRRMKKINGIKAAQAIHCRKPS
jgi:hypothetical protein